MANIDDILDDMSLSDDEMLDNLADDMLMELDASDNDGDDNEAIEEIHTTSSAARNTAPSPPMPMMPMGFPAGMGRGGGAGGGMPDLSKMMSQMMPMMSQMFGGGAGSAQPRANALHSSQQSWEDVVRQHVPAAEQREWLDTIRRDAQTLRALQQQPTRPPSRAYQQNATPLPNAYLHVEPLLAHLLHDAVRAARCDRDPKWRDHQDDIKAQLTQVGLTNVFARDLKQQLRSRVLSDPDFAAARTSDRFRHISDALQV